MGSYGWAAAGLMLGAGILLHFISFRIRSRRAWNALQRGEPYEFVGMWPHWRVWVWWQTFHKWRLGNKEEQRREFARLARWQTMWWVLENETTPGVLARLPWALQNAKLRFLLFWYHKGAADFVMEAYGRQEAARLAEMERREREAAARREEERRQAEAEEQRRRERERRGREERERREQRGRAGPQDDGGEPWGLKGDAAYRRACEITGLDGAFTKADLHRRYRDLQAAVHPDKGGSGYFAKQLNWARDVIVRRHGW